MDVDYAEGNPIAQELLPPTGFIVGRKNKPFSHQFYLLSKALPLRQFKDIDGTMLIEFRGTRIEGDIGLQSMVPPSIWTKGDEKEELYLKTFKEPAYYDADGLLKLVTYTAIGMLIAKNLGHNGFGHDARMAWAGYLLRLQIPIEALIRMGKGISTACNNIEWQDVRTVLETTEKRLHNEKKVQGGPHLIKIIGQNGRAVISRIRNFLDIEDPALDVVERLNERFAIISVGNKVVVMENLADDGSIEALWPFDEFHKLLIKDYIERSVKNKDGDVIVKRVQSSKIWLTHSEGLRYERLVYDMPGSQERQRENDYNGWLGFTVSPKKGDWHLNRQHLLDIICRKNESLYEWIFNWMAALVQWPGRHAFTSVVLRGGEGIGKGHFAHLMLGALFHPQQYIHILGAGMLTSQFNEHLSGKVLVFADESTWGGDPRAADKLKGMVTEGTIPIERKFLPLVEETSMLHIIIASNNEWPISIPIDDRRFVVLDVLDVNKQVDSYFGKMREELKHGGLPALLYDLQQHPIDESALRHPPSTEAKREVMMQSLKPTERWWYEKLLSGEFVSGEWPEQISKSALHNDYLQFLDRHKDMRSRRGTETELGMFLGKFINITSARVKLERVWILPSLEECRNDWLVKSSWTKDFDWEKPEQQD